MNLNKVKELATGDLANTETIAFRLSEEDKKSLLAVCSKHNLSVGRLMRALVREFMEEMQDD